MARAEKRILFEWQKKAPARAGGAPPPYVAWKKSPPFREKRERMGTHAGCRRYEDREGPRRESLGTFPKQLHLPRIRWHASAAAAGGSDNREHCQRFQCQPRHKNSLGIRA